MNLFTLVFAFTSSVTALAAGTPTPTVLKVPLFVEFRSGPPHAPTYKRISVQELNPRLEAQGVEKQLAVVELTAGSRIDIYAIHDRLNAAIEKSKIDSAQAMSESFPQEFGQAQATTCYQGDPKGVIDIVLQNTDGLYSDQFTLIAWRVGKTVVLGGGMEAGDEVDSYLAESPRWKKYDPQSDQVLILAAVGDDGTDVNESLIPRCR